MEHPAIFSATLGLSPPWYIVSVALPRPGELDISIDVHPGALFTCPTCCSQVLPCGFEEETWFHENFLRYATYLHARVPRTACCGRVVERPWSREGSRFTKVAPPQGESSEGAQAVPAGLILPGMVRQGTLKQRS